MATGQDNLDQGRGYEYTWYDYAERDSDAKYPSWVDAAPNLQTYLNAINKSQPIVQCQYELVWSRWPRAQFFAKGITIPGVSVNTLDLNHAGFTIKIPTHVTYETTEINLNIIADKEGFHYFDLRNMVLQTGHPLVAGDPRSTIGNPYGISPDEDTIEVRLRNSPEWDNTHHHWTIHNFKPTGIGDVELSQDGSSFVEFELTGTFTHITYDCGKFQQQDEEQKVEEQESEETQDPPEDENDGQEEGGDVEEEGDSTESEPDEYEDLREDEPEEEPEYTSIVSCEDSTETVGDDEFFTSTMNSVELAEPTSDEELELAEQCNDELTEASDDLKKELREIMDMPADPNYPQETVNSEKDTYNSLNTPKVGQDDVGDDYKGDSVSASV